MRKDLLSCPVFFALLFLPFTVKAQTPSTDTTFLKQAVTAAIQSYRDAVGVQAHLYTGPEYYVTVKPYVDGHQYFLDKSLHDGSVLYDGTWFSEVPLLYDLSADELVTIHQGSGYFQKMVKQKTDAFVLNGHTFVNLKADSAAGSVMEAGFYDLLYNGNVKVFARRRKVLQERATVQGMEGHYDVIDKFFIWKDGVYYPVGRKGSVLKVLRDEKKELNKFARANNLKFRKMREEAITQTVQHYDSLKR